MSFSLFVSHWQTQSRKPDIVLSELADSRKAIPVGLHFGDIYLHPRSQLEIKDIYPLVILLDGAFTRPCASSNRSGGFCLGKIRNNNGAFPHNPGTLAST